MVENFPLLRAFRTIKKKKIWRTSLIGGENSPIDFHSRIRDDICPFRHERCVQVEIIMGTRIKGRKLELELELIQTQMAQKPMLRAEVGMRVRCAKKASAE
jgi:hypothetical protein